MPNDICVVCTSKINIQIFRGTDVCSENCRKLRDGESRVVAVETSLNGKPGKK